MESVNIINIIFNGINEGKKEAAQILWDILISFFHQYILFFLAIVISLLIFSFTKAVLGRWGMLGSVLYNILYFGILFIVGSIWGPSIFVSNYFHLACTVVLYPICYQIVGFILNTTGLRRSYAQ